MRIDEFLDKSKFDVQDLATEIRVSKSMAKLWIGKVCSPRLIHALRIFHFTKGKVTFQEMLSSKDEKEIKNGNKIN